MPWLRNLLGDPRTLPASPCPCVFDAIDDRGQAIVWKRRCCHDYGLRRQAVACLVDNYGDRLIELQFRYGGSCTAAVELAAEGAGGRLVRQNSVKQSVAKNRAGIGISCFGILLLS